MALLSNRDEEGNAKSQWRRVAKWSVEFLISGSALAQVMGLLLVFADSNGTPLMNCFLRFVVIVCCCWQFSALLAEEATNLNNIPADLIVPNTVSEPPAAGLRVWATTVGWAETEVRHALYLPKDWKSGSKMPVLIEFPGNGGYQNKFGDVSNGTVDGCVLGYGLSGGERFACGCLPFVEKTREGSLRNCSNWWGDPDETKRYCIATVRDICQRFGGDPDRVVLFGFSRGAIACNYIGLRDDEIAPLWRAFFCHSHYDGVRKWPYADSDADSAINRLKRLGNRSQWISHELNISEIQEFVERYNVSSSFRFVTIPYPNHSAAWILRDLPERQQAREWLRQVTDRTLGSK